MFVMQTMAKTKQKMVVTPKQSNKALMDPVELVEASLRALKEGRIKRVA